MVIIHFIAFLFLLNNHALLSRSPLRPSDPLAPSLQTCWTDNHHKKHCLYDSHLQEGGLFHLYQQEYFQKNILPESTITYRNNPEGFVTGSDLSRLIENLLQEIAQNKKEFSDFVILKNRDFIHRKRVGLLVLKFKKYPFVVKLFIETPQSFVKPLNKGFEPTCFFMMGGGINRHLCGFTRVKNLEFLSNKITASPYWKDKVSFPRKWFWLPSKSRTITITGTNIGQRKQQSINIPSIYAVIADYIDVEKTLDLLSNQDRLTAMKLSNYLKQNIDPHINNYVIEKSTGLIVPLDTEHFLSMVGCESPPPCNGYVQWYMYLSCKMLYDTIGRTKNDRRYAQYKPYTKYEFLT